MVIDSREWGPQRTGRPPVWASCMHCGARGDPAGLGFQRRGSYTYCLACGRSAISWETARLRFFLGTHEPSWLWRYPYSLFVSHRRLARLRGFQEAWMPWALDSGGFSELSLFGEWRTTPAAYIAAVRRYQAEIGRLVWAAPQDWMCEPSMLAETGLSVAEHQKRTVASLLELRELAPDLPFIPVLQGWTRDDYLRCVDLYDHAGVDLTAEGLVGLRSVCRRQATREAAELVAELAGLGLPLHGFGVKVSGLQVYGDLLASVDSMAWSYQARREQIRHPGCRHQSCNNCVRQAGLWLMFEVEPRIDPALFDLPQLYPKGRHAADRQHVQLGLPSGGSLAEAGAATAAV
jgi:hypothetical protein